jgi:hypothetical protein
VGESHRSFDVIRQTGLSGGGQQQYKAPGDYVFKVTTPCDWTLDAGGAQDKSVKQPASAGSTTSTTPTTATTTEHAEASGPSPWPRAALR